MDIELDRRVRDRAYEIWESEGRPHGRSDQHWAQARAEFAEANSEAAAPSGSLASGKPAKGSGAGRKKAEKSATGAAPPTRTSKSGGRRSGKQ